MIGLWGFLMIAALTAGIERYRNGLPAFDAVVGFGPLVFVGMTGIAGAVAAHFTARLAFDTGVLRSLRHVAMFQRTIYAAAQQAKNDLILEKKIPDGAEPEFSIPPQSLDALHNIIADSLVPHLNLAEHSTGPAPGERIH